MKHPNLQGRKWIDRREEGGFSPFKCFYVIPRKREKSLTKNITEAIKFDPPPHIEISVSVTGDVYIMYFKFEHL